MIINIKTRMSSFLETNAIRNAHSATAGSVTHTFCNYASTLCSSFFVSYQQDKKLIVQAMHLWNSIPFCALSQCVYLNGRPTGVYIQNTGAAWQVAIFIFLEILLACFDQMVILMKNDCMRSTFTIPWAAGARRCRNSFARESTNCTPPVFVWHEYICLAHQHNSSLTYYSTMIFTVSFCRRTVFVGFSFIRCHTSALPSRRGRIT